MKTIITLLAILLAGLSALAQSPYTLPNNNSGCPNTCRIIPWQTGSDIWNGGVLPTYTGVACVAAVCDGVTDDTAHINGCIIAALPNTAVVLPAGKCVVSGHIVLKSQVVVRGAKQQGGPPFMPAADAAATQLVLGTGGQLTTPSFTASSNMTPNTSYATYNGGNAITNAPVKGDTTFTTSTGSPAVGNWISIFSDNDPSLVNSAGTDGSCDWCGENTGHDVLIQIVQITGVSGTTVTISKPLYYTLFTRPGWRKYNSPIVRAGYENLRVDGSAHDVGANPLIWMQGCMECWVSGVETYMTGSNSGSAHIEHQYTYGEEDRHNASHDQRYGGSGAGYGTHFYFANSDCKVEDNIYYHNRHSFVFEGGGSGCVVLYNYMDDNYTDDLTYMGSSRANHGAHPYMNLWEGNIMSHLAVDDFWGTSSHQTFFRNWLWAGETNTTYSGGTSIPSFPPNNGFDAVDLGAGQQYMNYVNNVLGRPSPGGGVWGTWSAATLSIACGNNNTNCGYEAPGTPGVYSYGTSLGSSATSISTIIRQANWDYKTVGVAFNDGGNCGSSCTYPASYYYVSKPSFIGACPWPEQGSDLAPVISLSQPAYQRAVGSTCAASGGNGVMVLPPTKFIGSVVIK